MFLIFLLLLHSDFCLLLGGDDVDEFAEALVILRSAQAPQIGFASEACAIAPGSVGGEPSVAFQAPQSGVGFERCAAAQRGGLEADGVDGVFGSLGMCRHDVRLNLPLGNCASH